MSVQEFNSNQQIEKDLYILSTIFRCRDCIPSEGKTSSFRKESKNTYCCVYKILSDNFPVIEIVSIIASYILVPTRSFLENPIPPSFGIISCYIKRNKNEYKLYMDTDPDLSSMKMKINTNLDFIKIKEYRTNIKCKIFGEQNNIEGNKLSHDLLKEIILENSCNIYNSSLICSNEDTNTFKIMFIPLLSAIRSKYYIFGHRYNIKTLDEIDIGQLTSFTKVTFDFVNKKKNKGSIKFTASNGIPMNITISIPNHNSNRSNGIIYCGSNEAPLELKEDTINKNILSDEITLNLSKSNFFDQTELSNLYDFETQEEDESNRYRNLKAVWSDTANNYVLSFYGHRITTTSHKNFKIIREEDENKSTVLQFGRTLDPNTYILDCAYPLSILQAFQIGLSTISVNTTGY